MVDMSPAQKRRPALPQAHGVHFIQFLLLPSLDNAVLHGRCIIGVTRF